jgi:hypothetical protein
MVAAAFHGGVLRITQKGLYVRTTIAMAPFHHLPMRRRGRRLPIDACTDSNACIRDDRIVLSTG